MHRRDTVRTVELARGVPRRNLVFETIKAFLEVLLFLLQELDLRVASLVECFSRGRVSELAI